MDSRPCSNDAERDTCYFTLRQAGERWLCRHQYHLEIRLGHAAVRTLPLIGHVFPACASGDAVFGVASRFVVEIVDFRWMTMVLRIYALGPDGAVKTLDVKDAMEAAARKLLRKMVRNEDDYAFSVLGASNGETPHLTVGNDGAIKAVFLMQIPKAENKHAVIEGAFRVTDRGGSLALKELSLRRSKIKPW